MLISENQGIRMSPRKRQFDLSHVMVLPFNITARTGPKICVWGASGRGRRRALREDCFGRG